jgi:hypothetical protein
VSAAPEASVTPQPDTTGVTLWGRASNFERGIYVNLWRWIRRRPDEGPTGSLAFSYVEIVRSTIWLWIGASALEMVAVHFIVPWPWLRWPLLIVSVWGLIWMFGFLAGQIVYPHLVEPEQLRVRNGHTVDAAVPISAIESVRTVVRSRPSSKTITLDEKDPEHLHIAVSGQVNVHVTLSHPVHIQLPRGRYTITTLSFWADEPGPGMKRLRDLISDQGA